MAATTGAVVSHRKPSKKRDAAAESEADAVAAKGEALAKSFVEMSSEGQIESAEICCQLAVAAFKQAQMDMAFAVSRAGVLKHGLASDKLCKRYLFMLDQIVKLKAGSHKKEGPPKMLYLREVFAATPAVLCEQLVSLASEDAVKAGEKCVLMKERGVMVVGLSPQEWRLLLEKNAGSDRMQMISGVEEAVVRGLSQSEGTPDAQHELKTCWNAWALKLCEAESGSTQLRSKCLLQRTVLQLQQQQFPKALESAAEVLNIVPESKHAAALLATAQHKAGKKKQASATVTELCAAFQKADETQMAEELGHPLELAVALLVEMHRTKDALKLLSCLLARVLGPRQQHLFFGVARLYAKHGLNKDALVLKLPSLCNNPPDRRTWELLKSMAECTPMAVEQQLQKYIDETSPGHFTHVPHITEVMCKLPYGAHGSAASKALVLLKECAAKVTPDRPEDLRIIVEDLRAFMSSNIPAAVSEQFPRTIESLLLSYMQALGAHHQADAWEMPAEMMKRSFGTAPSSLYDELRNSCLRLPQDREHILWQVFRYVVPEAGAHLVRAWLLHHDPTDVSCLERAATHLQQSRGEHAAALDLMRWAESKDLKVQNHERDKWLNLYFRVLRHTAEERAASMKRGGALHNGGLDMTTPVLLAGDCPMRLASFRSYPSRLTGLNIPLRNITQTEALVLREYVGDHHSPAEPELDGHLRLFHGQHQPALSMQLGDLETAGWDTDGASEELSMRDGVHTGLLQAFHPNEGLTAMGKAMLTSTQSDSAEEALLSGDASTLSHRQLQNSLGDASRASSDLVASSAGHEGCRPVLLDDFESDPAEAFETDGSAQFPDQEAAGPSEDEHAMLLTSRFGSLGLDGNGADLQNEDMNGSASNTSNMFTPGQLEFAMRALAEIPALKQRVPQVLHEDEAWSTFVNDLFLRDGWRHLGNRYGSQSDAGLTRHTLVGDVERLQSVMRQQQDGTVPCAATEESPSLHWLFELMQKHVIANNSGGSDESRDLSSMDPAQAADMLAFEVGQHHIWQQGFCCDLPDSSAMRFFQAPASVRAHLKLAFMHAADRLCSAQNGPTNNSALETDAPPASAEQWPLLLLRRHEKVQACHAMLEADPQRAFETAQLLLDEAREANNGEQIELLQLVCGDACLALKRPKDAINHFQRYAHGNHGLPLDAQLEYVCAMLMENFSAAQVQHAAEDSSISEAPVAEGWMLLVKVLAEMIDAENAIEQAAEEENRHMVNKLLMLLGSNVTNRRERDARMQRCLQEGGNEATSERETEKRRGAGSRRPRSEESGSIDIQQLRDFWASLPVQRRPELCRVPVAEFEKSVLLLSTTLCGSEREGLRETAGNRLSTIVDTDVASNTNSLLMHVQATVTEQQPQEAVVGASLPASFTVGGFSLSDVLCDIRVLAESVSSSIGGAEILEPTFSARNLFAIAGDTVTLNAELQLPKAEEEAGAGAAGDAGDDAPAASSDALVSHKASDEQAPSSLLERLLAAEAGFDLDGNVKDQPKLELGAHLSYEQVLLLVKTVNVLYHAVGRSLPNAKWALSELCRRLMRKEPIRAIMVAHRAVIAALARLMLRGVRTAFGEEQQKQKQKEAERAEQELLETLEAESTKLKDGAEGKKKAKKKKKRLAGAEGIGAELMGEGEYEGAKTATSIVSLMEDRAQPGAFAGWEDAAAIASAGKAAVDLDHSATESSAKRHTPELPPDEVMGEASAFLDEAGEDTASREAREAAEALAVVEAEEAAEEARLALLTQVPMPSIDTWEEVPTRRRHRKDRAADEGAAAEAVGSRSPSEAGPSDEAARSFRRKPRAESAREAAAADGDALAFGSGGSAANEDDSEKPQEQSLSKKRRNKSKLGKAASLAEASLADSSMAAAAETHEAGPAKGSCPRASSCGSMQGMQGGREAADGAAASHLSAPDRGGSPSVGHGTATEPPSASLLRKAESYPSLSAAEANSQASVAASGSSAKRKKGKGLPAADGNGVAGAAVACSSTGGATSSSGQGGGGSGRRNRKQAAPQLAAAPAEDESALDAAAAPGLENKTGQHSCFVNVVVQTLWNVAAFRDAFILGQLQSEAKEEDRSVCLAMKEVCSMMEDSSASGERIEDSGEKPKQATASALKEALYRLDSNFELGEMHDATEAHEALLEALHRALAYAPSPDAAIDTPSSDGSGKPSGNPGSSSDSDDGTAMSAATPPGTANSPEHTSLVKRIFSMKMRMDYAKPTDPNEEPSRPVHYDQWTQYVFVTELRLAVREAATESYECQPLVRVLRKEAGTELVEGQSPAATRKMLMPPLVFTLGLASDTAHASKAEISESLQGIQESLNLKQVYEGLAEDLQYELIGLTAFYESHYVCFCYSRAVGQWIHYDDDTRRVVGRSFADVVDKCVKSRLHPQLLFYEHPTER